MFVQFFFLVEVNLREGVVKHFKDKNIVPY